MRCLYCGKELALLKRLRGGGDFCSDAHKQSYQEEYNRLALSRLLQAQKKGQAPAQSTTPPAAASVAVEETAPEHAQPVSVVDDNGAQRGAVEDPVLEEAIPEALAPEVPEAVDGSYGGEESSHGPAEEAATSLGAEDESAEPAGFILESPAVATLAEETPYFEPWLELTPGPAMSEWQVQNGAFSLSSADLLSLNLRPKASEIDHPAFPANLSPQVFAGPPPQPARTSETKARRIANASRFPISSVIGVDIAPSSVASNVDRGLEQAMRLDSMVVFNGSRLLELEPTAIDFPAEDSDVVVLARAHSDDAALDVVPLDPGAAQDQATDEVATTDQPIGADGPRASLEALSRLHQELVEQEMARVPETAHIPEVVPAPVALQVNDITTAPEPAEVQVEVVQTNTGEIPGALDAVQVVELTAEAQKPKFAIDLFEISIKTFPPAKPVLIGGEGFPSNTAPLLPHLKFLPLRPKVALATGYVPPSQASAQAAVQPPGQPETKPAAPAATAVRVQNPPKAANKPAARLTQTKPPSQPAKPVQPRTPTAKVASPKADATRVVASPAASEAAAVPEASVAVPIAVDAAPKAPTPEKEPTSKRIADDPAKPAADKAKPAADQIKQDNVPSFDIAQAANVSWLGSLKVKLGIAILLLVVACVYFLGWGGSKPKTVSSNAAVSADGSGPSIIMGEGGWVEGWAGDPIGIHAGRQVTIYRPSLKLSDYRLEFEANIDTKSVGWVFRAADPENYYAMKLMTVSAGLSPKVALFKYLVANGRQTQVGRVPIDMTLRPDTVFNVRVDVRGPQFTTYIQGQQVDSWTDDQLKTGGAGFLNEREERGKVKTVSIRYLSGAAK
jgi:hypothetical protein